MNNQKWHKLHSRDCKSGGILDSGPPVEWGTYEKKELDLLIYNSLPVKLEASKMSCGLNHIGLVDHIGKGYTW